MRFFSLTLIILSLGCTQAMHAPASLSKERAATSSSDAATAATVPRHLIRRGRVEVTVADVGAARQRFENAVSASGGQIARLESHEDKHAYLIVRVPPDRLEAVMDSAAVLGKVGDRSVSAEDVTDRVVDAEARLAVLRASRDRLKSLIDRAANVSEVVTVERELARVQAELESMEARLNALRGQVAMSELSVQLHRRVVLGPLGLLGQAIGAVVQKLFIWR